VEADFILSLAFGEGNEVWGDEGELGIGSFGRGEDEKGIKVWISSIEGLKDSADIRSSYFILVEFNVVDAEGFVDVGDEVGRMDELSGAVWEFGDFRGGDKGFSGGITEGGEEFIGGRNVFVFFQVLLYVFKTHRQSFLF
jgi:hypothetical protein